MCSAKKQSIALAMLCFLICTDESPRHAERAGAKRRAAAGGGERHAAEVKKQGAMRSAPSEQCDYVSEGHFKSFCPAIQVPKPLIYKGFGISLFEK